MFSDILKNLRNNKNITQKDLAEYLNVSDRNIRFYEAGQRIPPSDILIKIADYFNVTTDYLLGREIYKSNINKSVPFVAEPPAYDIYGLSPESQEDLKKYIELLKIKDKQGRNGNKDEVTALE